MKFGHQSNHKFRGALTAILALASLIIAIVLSGPAARAADGEALYLGHCGECHQPDGSGIGFDIPGLRGAERVAGPVDDLIIWILLGNQPREGFITESNFEMPAFEELNDAEIAAITTYVLRQFGQRQEEIHAADVAAVRVLAKPD